VDIVWINGARVASLYMLSEASQLPFRSVHITSSINSNQAMSTPNDDEADRDNGTYAYREEEEEVAQYYTRQGIGYQDPPQYEDHEGHQRKSLFRL
jgi:hypothetical protein